MNKCAAWFAKLGMEKSASFKLLSVSGDCSAPGLYEISFGVTINDLLKLVGGEGAKAVQIGGASGGCIPAKDFGRAISFEDVPTGGSVIVFGQGRDMLHIAQNFMEFFDEESCGQCSPNAFMSIVRNFRDEILSHASVNAPAPFPLPLTATK